MTSKMCVFVLLEVEALPEVPDADIKDLKIERLRVEPSDAMLDEAVMKLAEGQKSFDPAPAKQAATTQPAKKAPAQRTGAKTAATTSTATTSRAGKTTTSARTSARTPKPAADRPTDGSGDS